MKDTTAIILIPLITGVLLLLIPEKFRTLKGVLALIVALISGYLAVRIYGSLNITGISGEISGTGRFRIPPDSFAEDISRYAVIGDDNLGRLIVLLTALFSILTGFYSIIYNRKDNVRNFFPYFLITTGCAFGAALSDNLILFITFWGILGITLYKLIPGNTEERSATAKKTLILIGASDSLMIIGIALIWVLSGTLSMSAVSIKTDNPLAVTAFFALLAGSFTKAGAFPFHTWVPDYTRDAPASSSALLPASLDKLLGIYLLARITNCMFVMNEWIVFILLLTGAVTIIGAVMMALVQHNYKRLLGFHAVSQVGYMILGFGIGTPLGVAAGLFHMLNNALYKSGLFLSSGSVGYMTDKEDIDDLGGLSRAMPLTFGSSIVFAMSISGIPPFNGFASKWMIYQGLIDFGSGPGMANRLWILWLGMAVLGSALTLASFIKFIGGIFLGRRNEALKTVREVPFLMWIPQVILALCCIVAGVFAVNLIVPRMLIPVSGEFAFPGFWNSALVSLLVLVSVLAGILIYLAAGIKKFRSEDSFIGGETIQDQTRYPTPEFYKTIGELGFIRWMYSRAEKKWFDIYDLSKNFVLWLSHRFSAAHAGVLPEYVIWIFAGLIIVLFIMI